MVGGRAVASIRKPKARDVNFQLDLLLTSLFAKRLQLIVVGQFLKRQLSYDISEYRYLYRYFRRLLT